MPAQLNYEHAPLRLCMAQLAERFQFAYWIDRRVDADKPLYVTCNGTLRECLTQLAAGCQAEVGLIENVVTIAQASHLADMQYTAVRAHDQLTQNQVSSKGASSEKSRSTDAQLKPLEWPMLTTPNELIQLINAQWQTSLPADLPHDLLNAGKLQACTLATQTTLLLGGFDKCAVGKRPGELRVVKLPSASSWLGMYATGVVNAKNAEQLPQMFPSARLQKVDKQWQLTGMTAAHAQLLQRSTESVTPTPRSSPKKNRDMPASEPNDPLGSGRYTIAKQANVPLGAVLKNLGQQLGLKVTWDSNLPPSAAQTQVTIEANNSKLDEILRSLGTQAKLSIVRQGQELTVSAPK